MEMSGGERPPVDIARVSGNKWIIPPNTDMYECCERQAFEERCVPHTSENSTVVHPGASDDMQT